jgi:hypothetical protein
MKLNNCDFYKPDILYLQEEPYVFHFMITKKNNCATQQQVNYETMDLAMKLTVLKCSPFTPFFIWFPLLGYF